MQKRTQNKAETPAIHFNERVDDDFPIHIMRNYLETKAPPIHTHDQFEIGYCVSGNGIFFVRDKIYPFKGGDISGRAAHCPDYRGGENDMVLPQH